MISVHILRSTETIVQKDASVEGFWNFLKKDLSYATGRNWGWAKGPARHRKKRRQNDNVSNSVSEKCKLEGVETETQVGRSI